jgi:hypothetical protein
MRPVKILSIDWWRADPYHGIPAVVQDNETGFLASEAKVTALAGRITSVLQWEKAKLMKVVLQAKDRWAGSTRWKSTATPFAKYSRAPYVTPLHKP